MEGAPKREMNTYTSRQKVSYCEAVHNLLSNYASEEIISKEYLKLQRQFLRQKPGEDERAFSRRIRLHADRMGTLYTSRQVIEAYVVGFIPTVRGLYSAHPESLNSFEQVVALCEKLGAGRTPEANRTNFLRSCTYKGRLLSRTFDRPQHQANTSRIIDYQRSP
jgi:hypothetical protein